jgi:hypothetical protein
MMKMCLVGFVQWHDTDIELSRSCPTSAARQDGYWFVRRRYMIQPRRRLIPRSRQTESLNYQIKIRSLSNQSISAPSDRPHLLLLYESLCS